MEKFTRELYVKKLNGNSELKNTVNEIKTE